MSETSARPSQTNWNESPTPMPPPKALAELSAKAPANVRADVSRVSAGASAKAPVREAVDIPADTPVDSQGRVIETHREVRNQGNAVASKLLKSDFRDTLRALLFHVKEHRMHIDPRGREDVHLASFQGPIDATTGKRLGNGFLSLAGFKDWESRGKDKLWQNTRKAMGVLYNIYTNRKSPNDDDDDDGKQSADEFSADGGPSVEQMAARMYRETIANERAKKEKRAKKKQMKAADKKRKGAVDRRLGLVSSGIGVKVPPGIKFTVEPHHQKALDILSQNTSDPPQKRTKEDREAQKDRAYECAKDSARHELPRNTPKNPRNRDVQGELDEELIDLTRLSDDVATSIGVFAETFKDSPDVALLKELKLSGEVLSCLLEEKSLLKSMKEDTSDVFDMIELVLKHRRKLFQKGREEW